ncbi:twin-arginine translocase subunit TatC [Corynebacterium bovis]|uniref:Sec-independent protein translocase protein TatC n=6 Tax=Corynebacterium bovis TaxID=36808 RepID=A0A3R8RD85_9CORY|nr:twin-arginine translocase subunit TatC [Corynebacterium bovis]MDK8509905.1 twin-arginine translocase subunit TatC [Corynebacterium bovis]RRO85939.1 twin-arginine translocase subunit TatC [Corynebacterium bovis]RRO86038.1 twin-arginine translocase subunit TatC [Corynebacterium bovis]RRO92996.1 twin-arginine translocase subunit TatC [Corynebacterium bovis]RRO98192.1 twin-arginine translocase subunit TatC [Corynebacterium bovis]
MSLVEHVKEFRRRLLISLAALAVGTVLGYIWYSTRVGPVPSLAEILTAPYCSVPAEQRFGSSSGDCRLLATSPFEMFILRLKVGALAGAVFSSPVWLTQIWGFITPGLKKNERRWTLSFVVLATLLFTAGAVLAYFILAYGLEFLLTIGDKAQIAALTGEKYFSFALHLLLIFGVSFEVPLITAMLNLAGILSYEQLRSKRRYIITVMFIFAAFATPGQDPFSMIVLALALCLMMETATQFAHVNDRRRKRKVQGWLDLDDTEASPVEAAAPVAPSPAPAPAPRPTATGPATTGPAGPTGTGTTGPHTPDDGYFDDVL